MMTFGRLAETQVRSPEYLRLDTVLLNTEGHVAAYVTLHTEKEKQPFQLGYDFISTTNTFSLTI